MRALNLDQLQTLVSIADLGTFAAASRALHLAPPTVSLHIAELEARMGVPLLERGPRRALPTAAGAALLDHARRLLKEADDAATTVRRIAQGRAGKVRLGTSTGVIVHLLPQVLGTLAEHAPDIDVDLAILGSNETVERLQAGTLDIGVVALPQPASDEVLVTPWRSDPMMAFLPSAWAVPRSITPGWLADKPLIFNDASTRMYRLTMEWFASAGHSPRARIELNYTLAMKSLVAAGYGAALLPMEEVGGPLSALDAGMQLRPLKPALVRTLGIAHRAEARLDAAAREVLAVLRGFAQKAGPRRMRASPPAGGNRRPPRSTAR
ncbi:LysR family transcriptional regulator [uncultured Aquincola sp.]|uniref:LysR family transcriptional regulator n=1 Tax=uncultured Aquincola sp. TaxID=886556 RepID=UPI0032B1EAFF